jgi:hypothetical protein
MASIADRSGLPVVPGWRRRSPFLNIERAMDAMSEKYRDSQAAAVPPLRFALSRT